jgi:hypothetical protein
MTWLIIILLFIGILLGWLLFSLLKLEVDTRIPNAELRWIGVGSVRIWYEDEWWLSIRLFFYRKTIRFTQINTRSEKLNSTAKTEQRKKLKIKRRLKKIIRVIKTFRVIEWQIAIDTGDHTRNAQLYPLNFLSRALGHLSINFRDENFLVLKISNRPWKILYAFLR